MNSASLDQEIGNMVHKAYGLHSYSSGSLESLLIDKLEFLHRRKDNSLYGRDTYLIIYDQRDRSDHYGDWLYAEWSSASLIEKISTDKKEIEAKGERLLIATGAVEKPGNNSKISIKIDRLAVGLVQHDDNRVLFVSAAKLITNGVVISKVADLTEPQFFSDAQRFQADARSGVSYSVNSL